MSKGTNVDILGKRSKYTEKTNGRPAYNREIIIRNLKVTDALGNPRYSNPQIARMVGCSTRTVSRIKKEALESGELVYESGLDKAVGIVEADFESETIRAKGSSFLDWLNIRMPKSPIRARDSCS